MSRSRGHVAESDYGRMIDALNQVHYAGETGFYATAPVRPCEEHLCRDLSADARVLDVGCGAGRVLRPLGDAGRVVAGVDINRAALRSARHGQLDARVVNGTMASLPFAAGGFDEVWCLRFSFNAVPTEAERVRTIGELWRVCAPGGTVRVEVFNWYFPGRWGLLRMANLLEVVVRRLRWLGQGRAGSPPLPDRDVLYLANKAPAAAPGYAHLMTVRELRRLVAAAGLAVHHRMTDETGLIAGQHRQVRARHRGYATWLVLSKPQEVGG